GPGPSRERTPSPHPSPHGRGSRPPMLRQRRPTARRKQMTALKSTIDPQSADFARNAEAMRKLVADLRGKLDAAMQGGSAQARERHKSRGKLLPRERVD